MTHYYVYRKDNGEFAGSGSVQIDDETHGSTETAPPEYDTGTVVWTGERWKNVSRNAKIVSPRQIRLALIGAGIDLATIEAAIADDPIAKIVWEYTTEVHRDDPMLAAVASQLGMTDGQVDAIFAAARLI